MSPRRRWARVGANLVWGLAMLVAFAAIVFAGMLAGGYLGYDVIPHHGGVFFGYVFAACGIGGVVVAIVVCHRARRWVKALRLRGCDASATATVRRCDSRYTPNPRGPGSTVYTVYLSWQDRSGEHSGERQYKFLPAAPDAFREAVWVGRQVPIRYPSARPRRFIIDLPYTSMMVDFFL